MSRVKLTNKTTEFVIEGELIREHTDINGPSLVEIKMVGTSFSNAFSTSDWEVSYPIELPTKLGAVIRAEYDGEPGIYCMLWDGVWTSKNFEVWASDESANFVVTEVLFEGIDK